MKRFWILRAIKIVVIISFAVFLFAYLVMYLWNWLLPDIIGVSPVTFVQAIGLLVLSRLLFGSFHRCGGGQHTKDRWRNKFKQRYSQMTEEEKRKFQEKFGKYCHKHSWTGSCDEQEEESESESEGKN